MTVAVVGAAVAGYVLLQNFLFQTTTSSLFDSTGHGQGMDNLSEQAAGIAQLLQRTALNPIYSQEENNRLMERNITGLANTMAFKANSLSLNIAIMLRN